MFIFCQLLNIATGQLRILKLIGCMLLLSHWNGCVQFLVPYLLEFPDNSWVVINGLKVEFIKRFLKGRGEVQIMSTRRGPIPGGIPLPSPFHPNSISERIICPIQISKPYLCLRFPVEVKEFPYSFFQWKNNRQMLVLMLHLQTLKKESRGFSNIGICSKVSSLQLL